MSANEHAGEAPPGVTREIARWAVAASYDDLPVPVREQAVRAFVNWAGCALGAVTHEAVTSAVAALGPRSGPAEATRVGTAERYDMISAALFNSMEASARVFDDTYLSAVVHPTSPVAAAALAVGEEAHASGTEFLTAIALGDEIACRAADMLTKPPGKSHLGLYMTGIAGGIGAAVAAARLMGLPEDQMVWAIGNAVAQASGVRALHGTQSTPFMAGNAARAGVSAALLARAGMTSAERALEGDRGFADVFASPPNNEAALDCLGQSFVILDLAYKPYPCGIVAHAIVDACLRLARESDLDVSAIERVDVDVCAAGITLTGVRHPRDHMNSRNSLHHWAAVALMFRRASITEEECIHDAEVKAMRERIHAHAADLAPDAANVRVTLEDGSVIEKSVEHCIGSRDRPMTDDEIDEKFLAQAEVALTPERARAALDACRDIEKTADVASLIDPLKGEGR